MLCVVERAFERLYTDVTRCDVYPNFGDGHTTFTTEDQVKKAATQIDSAVDKLDANKEKVQDAVNKGADAAGKAGIKIDGQGIAVDTCAHEKTTPTICPF